MRLKVVVLVVALFNSFAYSEEVNVGFEPFPPMINEDGTGYAVDMLNALAERSDLSFNVRIMTYARAKKELKENRLDLIGLTPKDAEIEEFYQYAIELDWYFNTTVDIFALKQKYLSIDKLENGSIGTLLGNAEFFSQAFDIPLEKFIEVSSLQQIVKMLAKGRLTTIIFERVALTTVIKQLEMPDVYYTNLTTLPASLAVKNSKAGKELKTKLDKVLSKLDGSTYLKEFVSSNYKARKGIFVIRNKKGTGVSNHNSASPK